MQKPILLPDETVLFYVTIIIFTLMVITQIVLLSLKYSDSNLILFFSIISVFLMSTFYYWLFNARNDIIVEKEILGYGFLNICIFIIIGYLISYS